MSRNSRLGLVWLYVSAILLRGAQAPYAASSR